MRCVGVYFLLNSKKTSASWIKFHSKSEAYLLNLLNFLETFNKEDERDSILGR